MANNQTEELEDYESIYSGEEIDEGVGLALDPDDQPTQNSDKLIKSGAVYDSLQTVSPKIKKGSISLTTTYSGSGPYMQVVTVSGVTTTANSKVDIQLTAAQITQLINDGVISMFVENDNGTLTLYAIGAAPTTAMTIQCTVTEVQTS